MFLVQTFFNFCKRWLCFLLQQISSPNPLHILCLQQVIRIYSLPDGTFSTDEDEDDEEDDEEEDDEGITSKFLSFLHGPFLNYHKYLPMRFSVFIAQMKRTEEVDETGEPRPNKSAPPLLHPI